MLSLDNKTTAATYLRLAAALDWTPPEDGDGGAGIATCAVRDITGRAYRSDRSSTVVVRLIRYAIEWRIEIPDGVPVSILREAMIAATETP